MSQIYAFWQIDEHVLSAAVRVNHPFLMARSLLIGKMTCTGVLPCRCLGSNGGTSWRTFEQDRHLDAILGPWLLVPQGVQEIARATFGPPSVPEEFAQIPQVAYLAMVQTVAEGQATPQRHPYRGWDRGKWSNWGDCVCGDRVTRL